MIPLQRVFYMNCEGTYTIHATVFISSGSDGTVDYFQEFPVKLVSEFESKNVITL